MINYIQTLAARQFQVCLRCAYLFCFSVFFVSLLVLSALPVYAAEDTYINSIGMEFKLIPAGSFVREIPKTKTPHGKVVPAQKRKITISKPFYLGVYEVTQEQWLAVMGHNPAEFKGENHPVEMVSWHDAQDFIARLNKLEGHGRYYLPTEAQWEYAACAGTKTEFFFKASGETVDEHAWYHDNSGNKTHPIGQKKPNPWGLYDIYGNVSEWVHDWHDYYDYAKDTHDPKGPAYGTVRTNRGGFWYAYAQHLNVARFNDVPERRLSYIGLRLALTAK